jgi:uncharacterized membrane protein YhaH (DUF805 family)
MNSFLFKPMGRLGFLLCIPVLGLLGYRAGMLILGTALQYPGHIPDIIYWTYFDYTLVFSVSLFFVQVKRLRSIGAPFAYALGISLAVITALYVLSQIPGGRMLSLSALWFIVLGALPVKKTATAELA